MKRLAWLLIALMLLAGTAAAEEKQGTPTETQPTQTQEQDAQPTSDTKEQDAQAAPDTQEQELENFETIRSIRQVKIPAYLRDEDFSGTVLVTYINDIEDIPFVDMVTWVQLMRIFQHEVIHDMDYDLDLQVEGNVVYLVRENNSNMILNFDEKTITFIDYDEYIHSSSDVSDALMDVIGKPIYNDKGEEVLFQHNSSSSFSRAGKILTLNLEDYSIPMLHDEDGFYVPLQTLADFLIPPEQYTLMYNGNLLMIAASEDLGYPESGYKPLGKLYYQDAQKMRSPELAAYSYCELCLVLDNQYGLKDIHHITSFDKLFSEISMKSRLLNTDPMEADLALYDFIDFYLDDLHSTFNNYSPMAGGRDLDTTVFGNSTGKIYSFIDTFRAASDAKYPDDIPAYEEVGDTAYIFFRNFRSRAYQYYYDEGTQLKLEDIGNDTISLIIYAHQQITRKKSPIKNVVIDLSQNLGGSVDAAIFVMGWVMGKVPMSLMNKMTDSQATVTYSVDVNLDGQYDEQDSIADKNIYCLTSPVSFSCGNLVPAAFKANQKATILGRTSGGGTATIQPLTTAYGTCFQISGPMCMSIAKNGAYYDIDQGVEPDVFINSISNFYNRKALTKFIDQLF